LTELADTAKKELEYMSVLKQDQKGAALDNDDDSMSSSGSEKENDEMEKDKE
jgi:hypothetical protein